MFGVELHLSDDDYRSFAGLVHRKAGINLDERKKELVRARLSKRIREEGFEGFHDYYQFVMEDSSGDELVLLLDAIATNLTAFFREPKHFQFMIDHWLPELEMVRRKEGGRRLRIWSAGCSTGEEAYSIAMTVLDHSEYFRRGDVKILATDLSTKALHAAWRAVYPKDRIENIPLNTLRRYFRKGLGRWAGFYQVKKDIRKWISFRRLNLIEPFPFRHPFDLIFCRNVMIYFDKKTQGQLVNKFHDALGPGGYLFVGHSESLSTFKHDFKYIEPTIYRKLQRKGWLHK